MKSDIQDYLLNQLKQQLESTGFEFPGNPILDGVNFNRFDRNGGSGTDCWLIGRLYQLGPRKATLSASWGDWHEAGKKYYFRDTTLNKEQRELVRQAQINIDRESEKEIEAENEKLQLALNELFRRCKRKDEL